MGITVPPAPSPKVAEPVLARLAAYANDAEHQPQQSATRRGARPLLVVCCALCALGIIMLACALAVSCAPHSGFAQLVISASTFLFEGMRL